MYRHISVLDARLFCSGFQNGICLRIKSADSGNLNYPKSMIGFVLAEHPMIMHLEKKNRMPSKSGLWDSRFYRMKI